MKFTLADIREVPVSLKIESDGAALVSVNSIPILRLATSGLTHRIIQSRVNAEKLKNLGFVMDGAFVKMGS